MAAWEEPVPFERIRPWALGVEKLGVTGFGWGAAWLDEERGCVRVYKDTGPLAEDEQVQEAITGVRSRRWMVHFRRPSRLSTVQPPDTQPFVTEDGGFAFSHNGEFRHHDAQRAELGDVLRGRADSEVGFRVCERLMAEGRTAGDAVAETHARLEGRGNLVYLGADGTILFRAANRHNLMWTFEMEGGRWASSALHSADQSLFDMLFRDAENRRAAEVPSQVTVAEPLRVPAPR